MRRRHLYDNPKSPDFTLGDLRALLDFVRAQQQDPRLSMKSHAMGLGMNQNTWRRQLTAIEDDVGCELVGREGQVTAAGRHEVTIDGEIWAEYAELVLNLYKLTRHATDLRPVIATQTMQDSTVSQQAGLIVPFSEDDVARTSHLSWLKAQNAAMATAKEAGSQNGSSIQDILTLVPMLEREEAPPLDWGARAPYDPSKDIENFDDVAITRAVAQG